MNISLEDGKYTLTFDGHHLKALRYGEPWRDLTGDGLVLALGHRIEELEVSNAKLRTGLSGLLTITADLINVAYDEGKSAYPAGNISEILTAQAALA